MADPKITNMAEARAALDAEIAGRESTVAYRERDAAKANADLDGARSALYALKGIRDRMEAEAE